jgi:hypothetical protein
LYEGQRFTPCHDNPDLPAMDDIVGCGGASLCRWLCGFEGLPSCQRGLYRRAATCEQTPTL